MDRNLSHKNEINFTKTVNLTDKDQLDKFDKFDKSEPLNQSDQLNPLSSLDPFLLSLNNTWVVYQYSKNAFKKLSSKSVYHNHVFDDSKIEPYKQLYKITNVGEMLGFIRIMGFVPDPRTPIKNLDKNDLVIMREGIEPMWEDEKNASGGAYSFIIEHKKGYQLWSLLMMYILGETFTQNMKDINGLSISYIKATNNIINTSNATNITNITNTKTANGNFTYLKIWNSNPNNSMENMSAIFPSDIISLTKDCTKKYLKHNTKKDFNQTNMDKLKTKIVKKPDIKFDDDGFSKVRRKKK
jgi:hypothetical protein